jgi:hypothetical protein
MAQLGLDLAVACVVLTLLPAAFDLAVGVARVGRTLLSAAFAVDFALLHERQSQLEHQAAVKSVRPTQAHQGQTLSLRNPPAGL